MNRREAIAGLALGVISTSKIPETPATEVVGQNPISQHGGCKFKISDAQNARMTNGARSCLQLAHQESIRAGHFWIGTEHVLIGMVKLRNGIASVLIAQKAPESGILRAVREKMPQSGNDYVFEEKFLTPRLATALSMADLFSAKMRHWYIGTEHILLGVLSNTEDVCQHVLSGFGITLEGTIDDINVIHKGLIS